MKERGVGGMGSGRGTMQVERLGVDREESKEGR